MAGKRVAFKASQSRGRVRAIFLILSNYPPGYSSETDTAHHFASSNDFEDLKFFPPSGAGPVEVDLKTDFPSEQANKRKSFLPNHH